jgi:Tol biopolymer transport system component
MTDVELDVADSFERVFPVPTVVADWDDVLDRAGARSATPTRPPSRWRVVAIAAAIIAAVALLATPALGIGDRLLSLIQSKPDPARRAGSCLVTRRADDRVRELARRQRRGLRDGRRRQLASELTQDPAKDVHPAWSPDGRRIAFVSRRDGNSEVYVMNADGSGKRNLTRTRANDDSPTWSRDGRRIAFLRERTDTPWISTVYVMNADGSGLRRLSLRLPEGTPQTTGRPTGGQLVWSPDGRTIYFGRYLVRTDGSGARRLPYIPLTAVWSPDGRRIAFTRPRPPKVPGPCCDLSAADIYVMNADGSGSRKLTHSAGRNAEPAWSPDGRKIAFRSTRNGGNREIYVMNADGSNQRNLTRNPAKDVRPSWSPDGRRIAFVSDRDGRLEAHVMNADGSGQRSLALQAR